VKRKPSFENRSQERVIGIVGGLGPFAHLAFERHLLEAMTTATRDQDYPAWLVSSIPATPSLAQALLADGPSPVPVILASLARLGPTADFAVIACNTAHAYFDHLELHSPLPLVHMIEEVIERIVGLVGERARVGVLGITAMLESQLYPRVAQASAPGLDWIRLHDLENGRRLHESLTMRPIYGRLSSDGRRDRSGIKDGAVRDRETGRSHRDSLAEAVERLHDAGAQCVVAGCTEISAVLDDQPDQPSLLVNPLAIAAEVALAIAYGDRPLPRRRATQTILSR